MLLLLIKYIITTDELKRQVNSELSNIITNQYRLVNDNTILFINPQYDEIDFELIEYENYKDYSAYNYRYKYVQISADSVTEKYEDIERYLEAQSTKEKSFLCVRPFIYTNTNTPVRKRDLEYNSRITDALMKKLKNLSGFNYKRKVVFGNVELMFGKSREFRNTKDAYVYLYNEKEIIANKSIDNDDVIVKEEYEKFDKCNYSLTDILQSSEQQQLLNKSEDNEIIDTKKEVNNKFVTKNVILYIPIRKETFHNCIAELIEVNIVENSRISKKGLIEFVCQVEISNYLNADYTIKKNYDVSDKLYFINTRFKCLLKTIEDLYFNYLIHKTKDTLIHPQIKRLLKVIEQFGKYIMNETKEWYVENNIRNNDKRIEVETYWFKIFNDIFKWKILSRVDLQDDSKLYEDLLEICRQSYFSNVDFHIYEIYNFLLAVPQSIMKKIIDRIFYSQDSINFYIFLKIIFEMQLVPKEIDSILIYQHFSLIDFHNLTENDLDNIRRYLRNTILSESIFSEYNDLHWELYFFLYKTILQEYGESKDNVEKDEFFEIMDYLEINEKIFNIGNLFYNLYKINEDASSIASIVRYKIEYIKKICKNMVNTGLKDELTSIEEISKQIRNQKKTLLSAGNEMQQTKNKFIKATFELRQLEESLQWQKIDVLMARNKKQSTLKNFKNNKNKLAIKEDKAFLNYEEYISTESFSQSSKLQNEIELLQKKTDKYNKAFILYEETINKCNATKEKYMQAKKQYEGVITSLQHNGNKYENMEKANLIIVSD